MVTTSTQPSGPPMAKVIATKTRMKGRSDTADKVAEAKKSRTTSICPRWCA
jgi:hypothetical protein